MAQNDIYLVRESSDGTFEEIANSPFRYDAANATDSPDKANNTFHINTKLRVDELEVNGETTIIHTDANTTEQLLVTNDGTGPAVVINQIGAESLIDIQDDGSSAFYIEDGGNVGIGITNPDSRLHVMGSAKIASDSGAASLFSFPGIGNSNVGAQFRLMDSTGDVAVDFTSNSSYIFKGGNVGIGLDAPTQPLDVAGNIKAQGLEIDGDAEVSGKLLFSNHYSQEADLPSPSTYHGMFAHVHSADRAYFSHAGEWLQLLNMTTDGKVGIGTTTPSATLNVVGPNDVGTFFSAMNDGAAGVDFKRVGNSEPYNHFLFHNGRVGIGTTTPSAPLEISTTSDEAVRINQGAGAPWNYLSFYQEDQIKGFVGSVGSADVDLDGGLTLTALAGENLYLRTAPGTGASASNRVTVLNSNGNVGIGYFTSSAPPLAQLHVEGHSRFSGGQGYFTRSSSDAAPLYAEQTGTGPSAYFMGGNVGVGTTSPITKLQVHSDTPISQTIGVTTLEGSTVVNHASIGHGVNRIGNLQLANAAGNLKTRLVADGDSYFDGGNLGIGTTSPDGKLHLESNHSDGSVSNLVFNYASNMFSNVIPQEYGISYSEKLHIGSVNTNNSPQVTMTMEKDGNVGIGTTTPSAPLEISTTSDEAIRINQGAGAPWNYLSFYQGDQFKGFVGSVGSADTDLDGGLTLTALAGENLYLRTAPGTGANASNRVTVLNSNGNVGIGYFTSSAPPTRTLDVNGDINFTGDLYQDGTLFSGGGGGSGGPGGTSFGGGSASSDFPNPLDVSGDTSSGVSLTINSTHDDGTGNAGGKGNNWRLLSDGDGSLQIGTHGSSFTPSIKFFSDGSGGANAALIGYYQCPPGVIINSSLHIAGKHQHAPGTSYNQNDTELKSLDWIGHKSTYYNVVRFDLTDPDPSDELYYFHLVFRGAGTGIKYKLELASTRKSTSGNTVHNLNSGYLTDESFAYFEDDLDHFGHTQFLGSMESIGDIEIVERTIYPTRESDGPMWGMEAAPGSSDLTADNQANYIVRYAIKFNKSITPNEQSSISSDQEGTFKVQLEVMTAGEGNSTLANNPHFMHVPASTAAADVTGLAYDPSPSTANRMHFGWNEVAGAGRTYRIQVATDSSFINLVHSVPSYNASSESASGLTANTLYYIRVKANPIAGESMESLNWATTSATTKT